MEIGTGRAFSTSTETSGRAAWTFIRDILIIVTYAMDRITFQTSDLRIYVTILHICTTD
jgi:hypothetical protein